MAHARNILRWVAIAGDVVFVAWLAYNAIDSGFRATPVQLVVYVGLVFVLVLNAALLARRAD